MSELPLLRSDRYRQLKSAAIAAFVGGHPPSQRDLAEIIAGETGLDGGAIAQNLTPFLRRLEKRGTYIPQRAAFGSKGDGMVEGQGTSPAAFNWSRSSIESASMRTVAECYLSAPDVKLSAKHAFRSAVRCAEVLPTRCSDIPILHACGRTDAAGIHGYAARAYDKVTAPPASIDAKTARNHRAALRAAVRYAAERDAIPLVFPSLWLNDAWGEARDRYWPLAATGRTDGKAILRRTAWTAYSETSKTLFGHDVRPDEITADQAEEAIRHLQIVEGRIAVGYNVRLALRDISARLAEGPLAGLPADDEFIECTPAGPRPRIYLCDLDGGAADGDWGALCLMLQRRGLPEQLIEFIRWYEQWITMDTMQILLKSTQHPPRRDGARLDDATLEGRALALRAFLGTAIKVCDLEPSALTPDVVFGHQFALILEAMVDWWTRRAQALADGAMGTGKAGAIRQHVIAIGQFALACYERLRHARGQRVHVIANSGGDAKAQHERLDWRSEEGAMKSAEEAMASDAYRLTVRFADAMAGEVRGRKGRRVQKPNEFKDLERIIRATPPSFWIELLDRLIEDVRTAKRGGRDNGWKYHLLVLDAFTLALYISTGCRNAELLHVRLDVQFTAEDRTLRRIRLRAVDRKNRKEHTVLLQPAFLPDDILAEYLDRTRVYFMRDLHIERGRPQCVKEHQYLLVSARGTAYGCIEEHRDGTGRKKKAFRRRARQHSQRCKTHLSKAAVRFGLALPGRKYEFGLHAIRGACGYAVYHQLGLVAAADYLGDTIDTAERAYSRKSGLNVDSSCLRGLDMRPKLSLVRSALSESSTSDSAQVEMIKVSLKELGQRLDPAVLRQVLRDVLGDAA